MLPTGLAEGIADADLVVVGTVVSTRSHHRVATVHREEQWKGHVAPTFEVFGGPADGHVITSVDRTFTVGERYLLVAREPAAHGEPSTFGGRYEDTQCSSTRRWTEALARYRPATATVTRDQHATGLRPSPADPVPDPPSSPRLWLLGMTAFAACVVAARILGIRHWTRRPERSV
jgi:hypothetical protein